MVTQSGVNREANLIVQWFFDAAKLTKNSTRAN